MTDLIGEYGNHLEDRDLGDGTVTVYLRTLRQADRDLPAGLVSACAEELKAWLCNPEWSKATKAARRTIFTLFFEWATNPADQWLDFNPAVMLPRFKVPRRMPRPAPTAAVHDVVVRAREPYRTWYTIAAFSGARCMEISNLDREDITEEEMLLRGKGGRERLVPTHPLIWECMRDLPPGPIARQRDGVTRCSPDSITNRGNDYFDEVGYPAITMHMLRHWFGTEAYEASRDILVVRDLMGHSGVNTTQIYVEVSQKRKLSAIANLPTVARVPAPEVVSPVRRGNQLRRPAVAV